MEDKKKILISFSKCPYCSYGKMKVITYEYYIPHFGNATIISEKCPKCGYKHSDILLKDINNPLRYAMRVDSKDDLNARVIKSSTATIKIPELGFDMTPGPASKGFITNVEGILNRVIDAIERISITQNLDPSKIEKIRKIKNLVALVKEGKESITLIVEDPFGNSAIVAKDKHKVKKEKLI